MTRMMVGLDGSAFAEQALSHTLTLSTRGDELLLMRVVDPLDGDDSFAAAEDYLKRMTERLRGDLSASVRTLVGTGPVSEVLAQTCAREDVDLLMMSTHGRRGFRRWLLGSVAEATARQCPCPVWLAPAREAPLEMLREPWDERSGPPTKILVPLDTSPLSDRALDFLRCWEPARGARLVLLAATDMRPPTNKLNRELRQYLHDCLEQRAQSFRARGQEVELRVEDDLAYESVLRVAQAEHADLIVMATHGRTGVDRFLTGSLAESVVRHCGCPAVLVPPAAG